jgi:ribose 5-phosphate isomerase B
VVINGANDNMKRFEIITEADAGVLDIGETVALKTGGHVTPLAADTLKARRVTVVSDDFLDRADDGLAPASDIRRIAIGSDHTGLALKAAILAALRGKGLAAHDLGTLTAEPVDYPDTAARVAQAVARGEADAGIVIDGAGIGSSIAANKVRGVRAAVCHDQTMARYARQHNGANVLSLGSTLITPVDALSIVSVWLTTPMTEPRYIRRLAKIRALEG